MPELNLEALRMAAERATPGSRKFVGRQAHGEMHQHLQVDAKLLCILKSDISDADGAFLATFDRETILQLIARLEAADKELERRKGDPVTRLHNICEALEDPPVGNPYSKEAFELADSVNVQQQQEIKRLIARLEASERELHAIAYYTEPHYRGAGLELKADWIIKELATRAFERDNEGAAIDAQIAARKE